MSDLRFLSKSRGFLRTQATKVCHKVRAEVENFEAVEIQKFLSKCEQLISELKDLDKQITRLKFEENPDLDFETECDACESYNQLLLESVALLKGSIRNDNVASQNSSSGRKLKLPELPLPTYSHGKTESLYHFLRGFENVLRSHPMPSYEKFVYLKRQLKGEPLALLESIEETRQCYEIGKKLLMEAFGSEITQKFDAIRRLSQLKMSSSGVYEYVSEMRTLMDLFKNLQIDVDVIIQYFVWGGLSEGIRDQLVNICNDNKPSLIKINENIFKAIDRCTEVRDRKLSLEKNAGIGSVVTNSYAVNVGRDTARSNKSRFFCSLCSTEQSKDSSHSTKDCRKYPTAKMKVEQLTKQNACATCGFINHTTGQCKFVFGKDCFKCGGKHMTYLCVTDCNNAVAESNQTDNSVKPKVNKNKVESKPKSKNNVNSGVVWADVAFSSRVGEESMLPTFTCSMKGELVRGLRDSGCQPTFIENTLADKLDLPVVNSHYSININGFNSSQIYETKIVSCELFIDDRKFIVNAICVPKIRTNMILPGLRKIARTYISKGYKLADRKLIYSSSDVVDDIQFVLGNDNSNIFVEKQFSFGHDESSVCSETFAGVLLMGKISTMLANLESLPAATGTPGRTDVVSFMTNVNTEHHPPLETVNSEQPVLSDGTVSVPSGGILSDESLEMLTEALLDDKCNNFLNYDADTGPESSNIDNELVEYALSNASRNSDGRIVMPLLWRREFAHMLGTNLKLAKSVLMSNLKKFNNDFEKLKMIDEVIRNQKESGIVEEIDDLDSFIREHPNHSFLAHMPVFKLNRATTKCRVVFLSNLVERSTDSKLSHNQALHPGPNLNQKITSALLQLRFGEKLMCYDLKSAFLQIVLKEEDADRLLFLWFKDINDGKFEVVAYRNLRLSFGLRCSPTLLLLSLFKILIEDAETDSLEIQEFKKQLYALMYMDNGAFSGDSSEVQWAYDKLDSVFNPYGFQVQQVVSNHLQVQTKVDESTDETTPNVVGLLGMLWHRDTDELSVKPFNLDIDAKCKRAVLSSIAGQYDVFNVQGPILNRARLFMHSLQCDRELGWDTELSNARLREWRNICLQVNAAPTIKLPRHVGKRTDDYMLIAFTDSSKDIYAAVIYIKNLNSGKVSFVAAKNRLVNRNLELKTIPCLEMQAVTLGVQMLVETYEELTGVKCLLPINIKKIRLYTDSMITLNWINSYNYKLDKMQKVSVYVMNRLQYIFRQCNKLPMVFSFISTNDNPADCLSRAISPKQLNKSSYLTGPSFLTDSLVSTALDVSVPNPVSLLSTEVGAFACEQTQVQVGVVSSSHLIPLDRYSSLNKLVNVYALVLKFVNRLKLKLRSKHPDRFSLDSLYCDDGLYNVALNKMIKTEQELWYPDVYSYLSSDQRGLKEIPKLCSKLNLYLDDGILKLKSKFARWKNNPKFCYPILLPKNSILTNLIIEDLHLKLAHAGCYSLLTHLKRFFWVEHAFSTVKKFLKTCVDCRKRNNRPVKLTQNSYRDFRTEPVQEPYSTMFLDFAGPFGVYRCDRKEKVWILCLTCLWSRAVNLIVCPDQSVRSFLRAFQSHVFQYGIPVCVFSDLGSQIVSGGNVISEILGETDTKTYLSKRGIDYQGFNQYFKGNSALGSLVEVCVKLTKKLIYGAIRNLVLDDDDFNLLIKQTIYLINSRPIAFQSALRDDDCNLPAPISPELLVTGREIVALNIVPQHSDDRSDPDWAKSKDPVESLRNQFEKLSAARVRLLEIYNEQFIQGLIDQATSKKDRYLPVKNVSLQIGDVVLLKEPNTKAIKYPMALVLDIVTNSIGEVTDVTVRKGKTREVVKRHVTSVIKILEPNTRVDESQESANEGRNASVTLRRGPPRRCKY